MLLLRQIFASNGGLESDTFKQLSAAFTVLRSLGSAQTATNRESSRIGHFIEAQVSSGELYRTKIHCYFLDQVLYLKSISFKNNLVNSSNYKISSNGTPISSIYLQTTLFETSLNN